jgi:hypothetical protein
MADEIVDCTFHEGRIFVFTKDKVFQVYFDPATKDLISERLTPIQHPVFAERKIVRRGRK